MTAAPAMLEAPPRWYAHRLNHPLAYRVGAAAAALLPRRARLAVAAALGGLLAPCFPAERAALERAMERIAAGADAARRAALVDAVFRHFAMCFADLVGSNRDAPDSARLLARVEGRGHLDEASSEHHGLVLLTAHVGNWELAGRLLTRDAARPTHVVVAAEADARVERFLRRGPAPVHFVTRDHPRAALPLVAALRRDEAVALQGDRALGSRGDVAMEFFGAPARFPLGPFLLARAAPAPLLPAFCLLDEGRRYTVVVDEPIRVKPDGEVDGLVRWVRALERTVRRHPEQWFNFFDVWGAAPAH